MSCKENAAAQWGLPMKLATKHVLKSEVGKIVFAMVSPPFIFHYLAESAK